MKHRNRLIRGDCLKIMSRFPKNYVNLVFGSPPYENARDLKTDPFPVLVGEAWVSWMIKVYLESLRVCKGLVAFVIQGRTRGFSWSGTPVLLAADLIRQGITIRDFIIYHRVGIPGSGGPDWLRHDCEYILCATNGGKLPWSDNTAMGDKPLFRVGGLPSHRNKYGERINQQQLKKRTTHKRYLQPNENYTGIETRIKIGGMVTGAKDAMPHATHGGRSGTLNKDGTITRKDGTTYIPPKVANPGNLFHCSVGGGHIGSKRAHASEAPFPEKLAEFMIRSFCRPNGIVLDPFSGSFTTCAVAKKLGRRYLGIDIRASQIDIGRRRLAEI